MSLKQELKEKLSETRAVSPVIGVILMVAITVILAAIIGTFVLGLGENVQSNASAGVVESAANDKAVTLNSLGPNTDGVKCAGASYPNLATQSVEQVGQTLDCTGTGADSIVAYSTNGDASNASVFTFDN
ncbi:type IV pilin [Halorussus halophilus]|uniref:type IV pilin n=1 Tax=Halorussus halophilus TaxID=2650975 RepID=UPI0013010D8C|nr:type IV pilin N-terminal domain-containing protein [Halorussus halophilus]